VRRSAAEKEAALSGENVSIRRALLWEHKGDALRCLTCERQCVLDPDQVGWCRTRENRDGTLVTLIYGLVSSLSCNPIEKKPFYHFYPGTVALTAGAYSCNFACPWCQNWHISKASPSFSRGEYVSAERFVELATERRCAGTSISFNEPTLSLEWSLDVFRLAHAQGLYNTYVTNGYMTVEALHLLAEAGLDAMNVDVKGDAQVVRQFCQADVERVWRNCALARERDIHVEVTTLVIPGVNDSDEVLGSIAERIVADLGLDVPWHVTRYYPAYRFTTSPTPVETLERAWQIGREAGLGFVYLGNVPDHPYDNTYCPVCGEVLVERRALRLRACHISRDICPGCGTRIPGVWQCDRS
jgi:pyruvate formate lyase activating enzyme